MARGIKKIQAARKAQPKPRTPGSTLGVLARTQGGLGARVASSTNQTARQSQAVRQAGLKAISARDSERRGRNQPLTRKALSRAVGGAGQGFGLARDLLREQRASGSARFRADGAGAPQPGQGPITEAVAGAQGIEERQRISGAPVGPKVPTPQKPIVKIEAPSETGMDIDGTLPAGDQLSLLKRKLQERGGRTSDEEFLQLRNLQRQAIQEQAQAGFQAPDVIGGRIGQLEGQRDEIIAERERREIGIDPELLALRKEQALERERLGVRDVEAANRAKRNVQEQLSARGVGRSTYAQDRSDDISRELNRTLERRREIDDIQALRLQAQRSAEGRQGLQQIDNQIQGLMDEQVQAENDSIQKVSQYVMENGLKGDQAVEAFVDALAAVTPAEEMPEIDVQVSKLAGYMADSKGNPIKVDPQGNPIRLEGSKPNLQLKEVKGQLFVFDPATGEIERKASVQETITGRVGNNPYSMTSSGVSSIGRGVGLGGDTFDNADGIATAMSSGSTAGLSPQETTDMITFLSNGSKSKRLELERAAALNNGQLPKQLLLDRFTDKQINAVGFTNRMQDSIDIFNEIENDILQTGALQHSTQRSLPNMFKSETFQRLAQAELNFLTAKLREESGAAISETDLADARVQYFPQAGDAKSVLKAKKENRDRVTKAMMTQSGGAYEVTKALESGAPNPALAQVTESVEIPGFDDEDNAFFAQETTVADDGAGSVFDAADEDFFNSL
jgi:hypothetical protein